MMVVKQLSGAGGYKPGYVTVDRTRLLTKGEWAMFIRLLTACYWQLPTDESASGKDGAQWSLKGSKKALSRRQQMDPAMGSYREACLYL